MNSAAYLVIGISDFGLNVTERLRGQSSRYSVNPVHFEIVNSGNEVSIAPEILGYKHMPVFVLFTRDTPGHLLEALGGQLKNHSFVILITDRETKYDWATSQIIVANEDEAFLAGRLLLDIGAGPTIPALGFLDIEAILNAKTVRFAQSPLSPMETPDLVHVTGILFGVYRDESVGVGAAQLMQLTNKVLDAINKDTLVRFSSFANSVDDKESSKVIFLYR